MKKLFTLLAIGAGLAVMTPVSSQAGDHHHSSSRSYSHSCGSCGSSVYRERVYVGRDCHGHPQYSWRTVSHSCSSHGHGHGHSHGGHSHGHQHGSRGHVTVGGIHIDF